ncbi:branched-chain amino acid ABC transporter permease [Siculibacillus lacustris]|uniref:Branched-chain amino acid ABC transporter permease n=1 Tax=Siculibacillus lacustris TaxID=1549641 RepID=A0A4Q9VJH5_9HYPH|nr:branched-chain amino acid ABC transporter permease [Siculibacillus lacustris]TBW35487.1 branched-chain amino acid ABC transporter permease [Siculibacillus lacustris]
MSSFDIVTSSFRIHRRRGHAVAEAVRAGAFAGAAAIAFALVGAYLIMDRRFVVEDIITLAQTVVLLFVLGGGHAAARSAARDGATAATAIGFGALAGLVAGLLFAAAILLVAHVGLRSHLVAASPMLVRAVTFLGAPGSAVAAAVLVTAGTAAGSVGAAAAMLRADRRTAVLIGLAALLGAGLFRDVFAGLLHNLPGLAALEPMVFGVGGVTPVAAAVIAVGAAGLSLVLHHRRRPPIAASTRRRIEGVLLVVLLVLVPLVTDAFVAQVAMLVGLYVLMAMGLNIELGLAGLVDLGFVAFFAVGAYTMALACSSDPRAAVHLSFWLALPLATTIAAVAGLLFGLPVLRVRGDYLAMATLGLGEIVRVLVVSDAMKPYLGGSQGIIEIARPSLGGWTLDTPLQFYFLALILAALVGLVSWRLQHSRIGRAWLAIREDEDVAQALGIDLVAAKLLAYTVGAAFAGMAGAVFAALIGSVYPHSFQLAISINVLAILVIGGLGSLPGVVVGSLVLIGLPELLREFGEFRYLFYGIALVVTMHLKTEGLWPAVARQEATDA